MDNWGWAIELAKILATGLVTLAGAHYVWTRRSREAETTHWREERQAAYAALLASLTERVERCAGLHDEVLRVRHLDGDKMRSESDALLRALASSYESQELEVATANALLVCSEEVETWAICAKLSVTGYEKALRSRARIPDVREFIAPLLEGSTLRRFVDDDEMQLFRQDARDHVSSVREAMRDDLGTPIGRLSVGA